MGYYIFSFAIDALKVKNAIGTTDPTLFDAAQETEEFGNYAEQDLEGQHLD